MRCGARVADPQGGISLVERDLSLVAGRQNMMEYKRLCAAAGVPDSDNPSALAERLRGPTIIQKAAHDRVALPGTVVTSTVDGVPRRCGGQGDVLSGVLAALLAWDTLASVRPPRDTQREALRLVDGLLRRCRDDDRQGRGGAGVRQAAAGDACVGRHRRAARGR